MIDIVGIGYYILGFIFGTITWFTIKYYVKKHEKKETT